MNITEIDKKMAQLLHGVHAVQRELSEMKLPTKYLNPRGRAMAALGEAQKALEAAELEIQSLPDAVAVEQKVKIVQVNIGENQRNSGGDELGVLQLNIGLNQRNAGRCHNKAD